MILKHISPFPPGISSLCALSVWSPVLILALLFMGCAPEPKNGPVVARVGKVELTLEELDRSMPLGYAEGITREQKISFVKQWIDNELMYQEALRRKLDRNPMIRKRLEKMKQDLLGAEIIGQTFSATAPMLPSEGKIEEYYNSHKAQFARDKDVIRFLELSMPDEKTAWTVRNMVTPDNFLMLAAKYSTQPLGDTAKIPYISIEKLAPSVVEVISQIRIGGTSSPILTGRGYSVFRIVDKQKSGSTPTLDEVRDEIVRLLSTDAQKAVMEGLLADLRMKTTVEFDFGVIPDNYKISPAEGLDDTVIDTLHE